MAFTNNERHRRWQEKHPLRVLLHHARERAKKFNLEFNLEESDLTLPDVCPILGIPIAFNRDKGRGGYFPNSPSIDRIDNQKGYVKENVQIISNKANKLKSDASLEDVRKLLSYMENRCVR